MKQDRRRSERIETMVVVRYSSEEGQISGSSLSRDVSEGGIGLPVSGKIPPGVELGLKVLFDSLSEGGVSATAKVVWSRRNIQHWKPRYSAGLRLLEMEPADRERLMRYAKEHRWIKSDFERALEENKVPVLDRRGDFLL